MTRSSPINQKKLGRAFSFGGRAGHDVTWIFHPAAESSESATLGPLDYRFKNQNLPPTDPPPHPACHGLLIDSICVNLESGFWLLLG